MKVVDKYGNEVDLARASIGKLKATLLFYEGVAYRGSGRSTDKKVLNALLPDEYGAILEELGKRETEDHMPFTFVTDMITRKSN